MRPRIVILVYYFNKGDLLLVTQTLYTQRSVLTENYSHVSTSLIRIPIVLYKSSYYYQINQSAHFYN